mgnify:CR=1 FL=1
MNLDMGWMAWTWQTATFFGAIVVALIGMTLWTSLRHPVPRVGVLGIETTPGDRLFISLLGSAYICLFALYFFGPPLWWALGACALYGAAVFRWV